ncbi:MAG TPA: hypothetical protein VGI73_11875 [Solirubrobacterales bacterium]|jgi:hypothetical protein
MDDFERQERIRAANRRRVAQRNRAGRLRGRVIAASLICFALLWGVVFVQMATGNDPVLSEKPAAAGRRTKPGRAAARPAQGQAAEGEVEAEPESGLEIEPQAEVAPEPEPEFEPEPEPIPEAEAEAVPEPEAELEPLTTSQS